MHECMYYMLKKINLTNYLYFIIKILFNFKCIHAFAWSYMLVNIKDNKKNSIS